MTSIENILEDFTLLDEWEDRYRYVIDLGKDLPPFPEALRTDATKVLGCTSQVWLYSQLSDDQPPAMIFQGDSDAHIVRGLIAVLFCIYGGKTPQEVIEVDATAVLGKLGLDSHLSPQRSNGLFSMVKRIRSDAQKAMGQP